jgi:hypothetical protein
MALEVTIFNKEIEQALYPSFDKLRVFAKQHTVAPGAKKVSVPSAGVLAYSHINLDGSGVTYPVDAISRTDSSIEYTLHNHEFKPLVIQDYDEFCTNHDIRASVLGDVANLLGAYAIRTIMNGFYTAGTGTYTYATTGSDTYTNRWTDSVKNLTMDDVAALAKTLDLQKVPRDGQRYLVLDPEMFSGFVLGMAAMGWQDTAMSAFQTGMINNVHGFNVMMLPEVGVATINNGAIRTPLTQGGAATDCNFGFALHKSFVGFAESGVKLFSDENSPGYYGTLISGSMYAGGTALRSASDSVTPIGCITVYEKAA